MDAPKSVWDLLDGTSEGLVRKLEFLPLSLDGAAERTLRQTPSIIGLRRFMESSLDLVDHAREVTAGELQRFVTDAPVARAPLSSLGDSQTIRIALQTLHNHFDTLRLQYARRLRVSLVARSSVASRVMEQHVRVMNRAGRLIRSEELIYLTARKAMLDWFNETQIEALRAQGREKAMVVAKDPGHEHDSALIDLVGTGPEPSYEDIADLWFHPRSNLVIEGAR